MKKSTSFYVLAYTLLGLLCVRFHRFVPSWYILVVWLVLWLDYLVLVEIAIAVAVEGWIIQLTFLFGGFDCLEFSWVVVVALAVEDVLALCGGYIGKT